MWPGSAIVAEDGQRLRDAVGAEEYPGYDDGSDGQD